jgi:hypothetical protein
MADVNDGHIGRALRHQGRFGSTAIYGRTARERQRWVARGHPVWCENPGMGHASARKLCRSARVRPSTIRKSAPPPSGWRGGPQAEPEDPNLLSMEAFHSTRITACLANGGALERAQEIAPHERPRTTKLYDRTKECLTQGPNS